MESRRSRYYFEFVGPHGSGKTFTYHLITKKNLLSPHKAIYPSQVKRPTLNFYLVWPFIAIKNLKHIIFVLLFFMRFAKIKNINLRVLRSLLKMIILHPYYYRFNYDVLLKDDMLHMLLRVIYKEKIDVEHALRDYLMHFLYLYDGFILVDTDDEVLSKRFKSRYPGKSEAFKRDRANIHERSRIQSKLLYRVITLQKLRPFIVIDGANVAEDNANKVVSFIQNNICSRN